MADTPELFGGPPAVDQTGNLTIWVLDSITDLESPTVAELDNATRITYSFTPSGYSFSVSTDKDVDDRLTVPIARESLGRSQAAFADFEYVDSEDSDSAAVVLADGGEKVIVERRNVPQTKVATLADKVRVYRVAFGPQVPGATDGTGKFRLSQSVAVQEFTAQPVSLA